MHYVPLQKQSVLCISSDNINAPVFLETVTVCGVLCQTPRSPKQCFSISVRCISHILKCISQTFRDAFLRHTFWVGTVRVTSLPGPNLAIMRTCLQLQSTLRNLIFLLQNFYNKDLYQYLSCCLLSRKMVLLILSSFTGLHQIPANLSPCWFEEEIFPTWHENEYLWKILCSSEIFLLLPGPQPGDHAQLYYCRERERQYKRKVNEQNDETTRRWKGEKKT